MNAAEREVCEFEREYEDICSAAKLFEVSVPVPHSLKQCRREIRMAKVLWDFMQILDTTIDDWKRTPWQTICAEEMDMECEEFYFVCL